MSVWWALTGDRGLVEAHDLAVRTVLEHLERYGATTRIRLNGHRHHPDANGLTMAVFQQGTSREDDPQLHSHVVVSAKVTAPGDAWMALDARYLKRQQRALGGSTSRAPSGALARYGVAWRPVVNGQAEIDGMPDELLEAFSKRTAQVEELLAHKVEAFRDREGRDLTRWERAAIAREAAEDSRATKTGTAVDQLVDAWREEAGALGWTGERVVGRLQGAGRQAGSGHKRSRRRAIASLAHARPSTRRGRRWREGLTAARSGSHRPSRTSGATVFSPRRNASSPSLPLVNASRQHRRSPSSENASTSSRPTALRRVAGHDRVVLVVGPWRTRAKPAHRSCNDLATRARHWAADAEARATRRALQDAPRLRRCGPSERLKAAEAALADAADRHAAVARAAAPYTAEIEAREAGVQQAERALNTARLKDRLDRLMDAPAREFERSRGLVRGR